MARNKMCFINGTLQMPGEDDPNFQDWTQCDSLVKNWITNCVSPDILVSISTSKTAHVLWEDLRNRYSAANSARDFELARSISTIKQGNSSITEYYARIKSLWDELDQYKKSTVYMENPAKWQKQTNSGYAEKRNYNINQVDANSQSSLQQSGDQYQQILSILKANAANTAGVGNTSVSSVEGNNFLNSNWIIDTGASDHDSTTLRKSGMGTMHNDLYHLLEELKPEKRNYAPMKNHISVNLANRNLVSVNAIDKSFLWHNRLGHPSVRMSEMLPSILDKNCKECDVCPLAKMKRNSFSVSESKTCAPFDLIHLDIWGPNSMVSMDDYKYFLTIVDDFTRATWIILMKNKSENSIREGITHQKTCTYTPQQNGIVERKHQRILNVSRAIRLQSGLPEKFWSHCVVTVVYLINRLPSRVLDKKSPYEILHNKKPDYSNLRIFGCQCYVKILKQRFPVKEVLVECNKVADDKVIDVENDIETDHDDQTHIMKRKKRIPLYLKDYGCNNVSMHDSKVDNLIASYTDSVSHEHFFGFLYI
ncbi:uncharacterized protein LOC119986936 [Tripterygium wilfordii]|uniref:uncharacterized protein LOC119986936 n=1 Tax=Tripterygium wilfordii TaxID=458696 RepID=UPI0018F820BF|nr:uncharacterized protein LOC119986936 [Tripterygium wilfordii]